MENKGYTFLEILSNCNTNWGMDPVNANIWIKDNLTKIYPVEIFRDKGE